MPFVWFRAVNKKENSVLDNVQCYVESSLFWKLPRDEIRRKAQEYLDETFPGYKLSRFPSRKRKKAALPAASI